MGIIGSGENPGITGIIGRTQGHVSYLVGSFSLCERMVDRMDHLSADVAVVIQCFTGLC